MAERLGEMIGRMLKAFKRWRQRRLRRKLVRVMRHMAEELELGDWHRLAADARRAAEDIERARDSEEVGGGG